MQLCAIFSVSVRYLSDEKVFSDRNLFPWAGVIAFARVDGRRLEQGHALRVAEVWAGKGDYRVRVSGRSEANSAASRLEAVFWPAEGRSFWLGRYRSMRTHSHSSGGRGKALPALMQKISGASHSAVPYVWRFDKKQASTSQSH